MPKFEPVFDDMRKRLVTNRNGILTSGQWLDMALDPVVKLLLLLGPGIVVLGPRLLVFGVWLWVVLLLSVLVLVGLPVVVRMRRYARMPVYFAVLRAGDKTPPKWLFWRPQVLHSDSGEVITFQKRLAPYTVLHHAQTYLVYYLKDSEGCVLLSLAPADHPDANQWQPSAQFEARFKRRSG